MGNGTSGMEGTEAIGKYYVEDIPGVDQHTTGWHGVCEDDAERIMLNTGYEVIPLDGYEDHPVFEAQEEPEHACEDFRWMKKSLITEAEGFDWVECSECGARGKRWGLGDSRVEIVDVPSSNDSTGEGGEDV
jgi:hypothetical protein